MDRSGDVTPGVLEAELGGASLPVYRDTAFQWP